MPFTASNRIALHKYLTLLSIVLPFFLNQNISAQFALIHEFGSENDLVYPRKPITDGQWIYGVGAGGGSYEKGGIYRIKIDGTDYQILHSFNDDEGKWPYCHLVIVDGYLYGMASSGGLYNKGTIFKLSIDGNQFEKIFDFDGTNGSAPYNSLNYYNNEFYGETNIGGTNSDGCLFKITKEGEYTKLFDFNGTNGDVPNAVPVISDSVLYGMTTTGGTNGLGTIYRINSDGSDFQTLLHFDGAGNGSNPYGSLILIDTTLYGMTHSGGNFDVGCIFKISINGSNYLKLLDLEQGITGVAPMGSLSYFDSLLYGMTNGGGDFNNGCIFSVDTNGSDYTILHSFNDDDGSSPARSLIKYGSIYGATDYGGSYDMGVLFEYNFIPELQSHSIRCTDSTSWSASLDWINGNGHKRAVFLKEGIASEINPVNSTTYIASNDWDNKGTELENTGYFCVYNDTGNMVILENLHPDTSYSVRIFEYRGIIRNENYLIDTAVDNPSTFSTLKESLIFWENPEDIVYGTPLGDEQLNASANISGNFIYTPPSGTVLEIGDNQILTVDLSPNDASYSVASKTVVINVLEPSYTQPLVEDNYSVYPNPASNVIQIYGSGSLQQIEILSITGVQLLQIESEIPVSVNISNLPEGVYYLRFTDVYGNVKTTKFLKAL